MKIIRQLGSKLREEIWVVVLPLLALVAMSSISSPAPFVEVPFSDELEFIEAFGVSGFLYHYGIKALLGLMCVYAFVAAAWLTITSRNWEEATTNDTVRPLA